MHAILTESSVIFQFIVLALHQNSPWEALVVGDPSPRSCTDETHLVLWCQLSYREGEDR